jgi:hypothetical protein
MTAPTSAPPSTSSSARCAGLNLRDILVPPLVVPVALILGVLVLVLIRYT